ncbi:3'(2'),5'-bisphosphate nucleotidase CysQ [Thermodesulfovibrio sp. 3462-1]|uniref:3'(2'),5'-bisphosphate nucleotidase CysQ n=1 Tax=Thermodesulfovibrio obliviosus TaxID=3118332 RepID=A0AAU8H485_9BACT
MREGLVNIHRFLDHAIKLSLEAGREILKIYNSDIVSSSTKSDSSPLTSADLTAHRLLSEGLSSTDLPVLSEEGRDLSFDIRRQWYYLWLIDPLDGTKEFLNKNGEFTVNIALIKENSPVIRSNIRTCKNILYYALKNQGAWKVKGEIKKRLPEYRRGESEPLVITGSRSHHTEESNKFIERLKSLYEQIEFVQAGSALKFCLVAEGVADIYPRFGPTMEWDSAAGQLIVEEAGGKVLDARNSTPLVYNKKILKNPHFVALNNHRLKEVSWIASIAGSQKTM